ncbi:hypothetical protein [Pseudodonghicola flavimaris]|uniref:Uncharacterized protein n=1 Tax=Pseudodonghicola flavimaris TaxID=3050036 RepID=A0ABT7EZ14_9RHOB|nr:hypothetical protein [Pseudodonghicola flavimaris]MDK3017602.1 hypothetical protein [Pseudodonghicola flavimaris]
MIQIDPQRLYALTRDITAAPLSDRTDAFRRAGGKVTPPGDDQWDYLNTRWWVELMELTAYGDSPTEAVSAWLRLARSRLAQPTSIRATDRRPDCPYNGQGLAP